jgi:hypothetical protein
MKKTLLLTILFFSYSPVTLAETEGERLISYLSDKGLQESILIGTTKDGSRCTLKLGGRFINYHVDGGQSGGMVASSLNQKVCPLDSELPVATTFVGYEADDNGFAATTFLEGNDGSIIGFIFYEPEFKLGVTFEHSRSRSCHHLQNRIKESQFTMACYFQP